MVVLQIESERYGDSYEKVDKQIDRYEKVDVQTDI